MMITFNVYLMEKGVKHYLGAVVAKGYCEAQDAACKRWGKTKYYLRMCM